MIHKLSVKGLYGKMNFDLTFNEDLNLLTGRNGCGKTTILKILWYILSGNFNALKDEVEFNEIRCAFTDDEDHLVEIKLTDEGNVICLQGSVDGQEVVITHNPNVRLPKIKITKGLYSIGTDDTGGPCPDDSKKYYDGAYTTSVFFPTFRRIEGGFGTEAFRDSDFNILKKLSQRLSSPNHKFVASISTDDIVSLFKSEYVRRVKTIINLQQKEYNAIAPLLTNEQPDSEQLINYIKAEAERREQHLKPFDILDDLIKLFFDKKGVTIDSMILGHIEHAIRSDKLSSGEKQMLSFLCYNIFTPNSCIFIDEPELSLHPDWQRMLIPRLLEQGNHNQYFLATHSPCIYAVYPDKEIILDEDKGGQ